MQTDLQNLSKNRAIDPTLSVPTEHRMLFEVMDGTGDTKHIWDRSVEAEVEAARALYDALTKKKYVAFHVTGKDGEKGEQMRTFDPKAERVIFVPPMAGG